MGIHYHVVNVTKRETLPLFAKLHELTRRERAAFYLLLVEAPPGASLLGRWCGDAVALVTDPLQVAAADGSSPSLPPHDLDALLDDLFEERLPVLPLDEILAPVEPVVYDLRGSVASSAPPRLRASPSGSELEFSGPKPELDLLATTVRKLRKHPIFSARYVPCDLDLRETLDPAALVVTHGSGALWRDLSGTAVTRALVTLLALGGRWSGHRIAVRPEVSVKGLPDVSDLVGLPEVSDLVMQRHLDPEPPGLDVHREAWRALDAAVVEIDSGKLREAVLALRVPVAWLVPLARAVPWRSWDLASIEELVARAADPARFRSSAGELRRTVDMLRGLLCVIA